MRKMRPLLCALLMAVTALPAWAQYDFQFEVPDQGAVAGLSQLTSFDNLVINTGTLEDTYSVTVVKNMPPDWVGSLCQGTLCYPPFVTEITFTLAPGDTTDLLMDITPLTDLASGTAVLTLASQGDPALSVTREFTVVTPGLNVLLVDGDGGATYETWYEEALDGLGLTYGRWDRTAVGGLDAAELASFPTTVWLAGDNSGALDPNDLASLRSYLQQGGDLVLGGQNLARDFCSPGGAWYSTTVRAEFKNTLGADFATDDAGDDTAVGVAGDPVAAGLSLTLSGGSGASHNTSPDEILPVSAGTVSIRYASGGGGAVTSSYNLGRSYFMAFGFENISSATTRRNLLDNIMTWLSQDVSAAPEQLPTLFATVPRAAPNPFNPRTHIRFSVGGEHEVPGSVAVYDLRGRRLRDLQTGSFAPGPVDLTWDGKDDAGAVAGAGMYLARIVLDGQSRTLKLTLAK